MQGKGTCPEILRHERVRALLKQQKKDHRAGVKRRLEISRVCLCRALQPGMEASCKMQ